MKTTLQPEKDEINDIDITPPPRRHSRAKAFGRRFAGIFQGPWAEYWSSHDMERLLTLFTDDVVYEDVTMGVVNRGRSELRAFAEGFFSDSLT